MSQCVPSWDLDDHPKLPTHPPFNHLPSRASLVPRSDYEVTELAWENGRLVLHGLGRQRIEKPIPKEPSSSSTAAAAWEKPRPSGTLEAVVDQATRPQLHPSTLSPDLAAWLAVPQVNRSTKAAMDAIVPCTNASSDNIAQPVIGKKRPRVDGEGRWVYASQGSTAVPEAGRTGESTRPTLDTGRGDDVGFTTTTAINSASPSRAEGEEGGSPETENTSFDGGVGGGGGGGRRKLMASDDRDSVCLFRRSEEDCDRVCADEEKIMKGSAGRVSASTRTGRAAAIHNQSERKRRDRINQRIQTLQKLVPNSSKTDKASILDEVIEYLKKLQAQVQMMSRMSTMMMPMAMPQFQMSMMAHMAQMVQMAQMGMGMGMMDLNSHNQLGYAGLPPFVHPSTFLPLSSSCWAGSSDKMQQPGGTILSDPFSAFVAYQTAQQQLPPPPPPPVGMDAYNWMAALYQQLNQQPPPGNPKP